MKARVLRWMILCSILLGLVGCAQENASPFTPTATPTVTPTSMLEKQAEYLEVFEIVWGTVDETYFDPSFGGVDWEAIHDEYLPRIATARDDEAFYIRLNEMCFELGVSHFVVVPHDSPTALEPVLSAQGTAGLDVRLVDDQVVVTAVEAGSPADRAGLRAGYILSSIDGASLENREEMVVFRIPPFNERRMRGQVISAIQSKFFGEPDQEVAIAYLDEREQMHEVSLVLEAREGQPFSAEGLPPMYVTFEATRLEGGIAYLRFNGFLPPILEDVLGAIQDMLDAPAMIIDIRGNPGGFYPVRKAIASQFFQERTLLWRFITRPGLELPGFETEGYTDPPAEAYLGPVVVLVDVMSGSSSEEFAGAMDANNRATIIGERTPGSDLVADMKTLPNGALLLYPIAQTQTADGTVLEGRGVIPDIEVALDRQALLQGVDAQLEAAIQYLEQALVGE